MCFMPKERHLLVYNFFQGNFWKFVRKIKLLAQKPKTKITKAAVSFIDFGLMRAKSQTSCEEIVLHRKKDLNQYHNSGADTEIFRGGGGQKIFERGSIEKQSVHSVQIIPSREFLLCINFFQGNFSLQNEISQYHTALKSYFLNFFTISQMYYLSLT